MEALWITLAGGAVGGAFALLGIAIGSRSEHRHWLRDQRRAAYADFISGVNGVQLLDSQLKAVLRLAKDAASGTTSYPYSHEDIRAVQGALPTIMGNFVDALSRVAIVGPAEILDAAKKVKDDVLGDRSTEQSEAAFVALARKVLQSK